MSDEVSSEVYTSMGSFAEHIGKLISFAKDSRYLPLHINEFIVYVGFVAWIRCASSLLSSARYTMLTSICDGHLIDLIGG